MLLLLLLLLLLPGTGDAPRSAEHCVACPGLQARRVQPPQQRPLPCLPAAASICCSGTIQCQCPCSAAAAGAGHSLSLCGQVLLLPLLPALLHAICCQVRCGAGVQQPPGQRRAQPPIHPLGIVLNKQRCRGCLVRRQKQPPAHAVQQLDCLC